VPARDDALPPDHPWWRATPRGRPPSPWPLALALLPLVLAWTLPQTLVGLVWALVRRARGVPLCGYRFGPFLYLVSPAAPFASRGISMGLVVLAEHPSILVHEFCHLYTAAWLGWLYLPAYGLEYLLVGHERSPHERLTCRFEQRNRLGWRRVF
jgi:hypothetical protein